MNVILTGQKGYEIPIVTTSGTGLAYTASVPGITELKNGMLIILIPHVTSESKVPTLKINQLKTVQIKRMTSIGTDATGAADDWLWVGSPFLLKYDEEYDHWYVMDLTKPDASDLDGAVPVIKGGTNKTSWNANQLIYPVTTKSFTQLNFPTEESFLTQNANGAPYWTPKSSLGGEEKVDNLYAYWWREEGFTGYREQKELATERRENSSSGVYLYIIKKHGESGASPNYHTTTIRYSDSISINQTDGTISLANPSETSIRSNPNESEFNAWFSPLKGKYIQGLLYSTDSLSTYIEDLNIYYVSTSATCSHPSDTPWYRVMEIETGLYKVKSASSYEPTYVSSFERNAYPDNGDLNGNRYSYLGMPFENARDAVKIEEGQYEGTGVYGSNNPNELTFPFALKMLFIKSKSNPSVKYKGLFMPFSLKDNEYTGYSWSWDSPGGSSASKNNTSSSSSMAKMSNNRRTISWYDGSVAQQLNESGETYSYIAIG